MNGTGQETANRASLLRKECLRIASDCLPASGGGSHLGSIPRLSWLGRLAWQEDR